MAGNRDPAACSRAVREAWANERELVLNGQGTRDWTPQQQADIVDGLVPRDDQGRPFEGHHMLSAEAYPQFQDDPENIQFLTRDEHLAAHENDFRNETSAYYDPGTGQSYASAEVVSAPIIELSEPTEVLDESEELGEGEELDEGEAPGVTEETGEAEVSEEGPGTDAGEDAGEDGGLDGGDDGGMDF